MAVKIEILKSIEPKFSIKLPLPTAQEDKITAFYRKEKQKGNLILGIKLLYEIGDFYTQEKYSVTEFFTEWEVKVEGKPFLAEELYPCILDAIARLNMWLGRYLQVRAIPHYRIEPPPLEVVQADLQKVVDWFLSQS